MSCVEKSCLNWVFSPSVPGRRRDQIRTAGSRIFTTQNSMGSRGKPVKNAQGLSCDLSQDDQLRAICGTGSCRFLPDSTGGSIKPGTRPSFFRMINLKLHQIL